MCLRDIVQLELGQPHHLQIENAAAHHGARNVLRKYQPNTSKVHPEVLQDHVMQHVIQR